MSETAAGDAAERSLQLLRAARTLTAELSVVRDLRSTLQVVVDGVQQLGMDGAVMNLVRPDGDLEASFRDAPLFHPSCVTCYPMRSTRRSRWVRAI